jgi:hypothetical protein
LRWKQNLFYCFFLPLEKSKKKETAAIGHFTLPPQGFSPIPPSLPSTSADGKQLTAGYGRVRQIWQGE